jgi:hypothetical protein
VKGTEAHLLSTDGQESGSEGSMGREA